MLAFIKKLLGIESKVAEVAQTAPYKVDAPAEVGKSANDRVEAPAPVVAAKPAPVAKAPAKKQQFEKKTTAPKVPAKPKATSTPRSPRKPAVK